jgi:hypothetical protein
MAGGYTFLIVFIIIFFGILPTAYILYYSLRGRRYLLRLSGNKILEDYGIISQNNLFGYSQTIRLLKCRRKGTDFYIFEESERLTSQGALRIYPIKMSIDSANQLLQLLRGQA